MRARRRIDQDCGKTLGVHLRGGNQRFFCRARPQSLTVARDVGAAVRQQNDERFTPFGAFSKGNQDCSVNACGHGRAAASRQRRQKRLGARQ